MKKLFFILSAFIIAQSAKGQTISPQYPGRIVNDNPCVTLIVEEYCIAPANCASLPAYNAPGTPALTTMVPPGGGPASTYSVTLGKICSPGDEYYYRVSVTGPAPYCSSFSFIQWFGDPSCQTVNPNYNGPGYNSYQLFGAAGCPCGTVINFDTNGDGGLWCRP